MVDYRDDYRQVNNGNLYRDQDGSNTGVWIALAFIALMIGSIFWFGTGATPENGTSAPQIETTPPAPVAPEAPAVQ